MKKNLKSLKKASLDSLNEFKPLSKETLSKVVGGDVFDTIREVGMKTTFGGWLSSCYSSGSGCSSTTVCRTSCL
ncbi:MAG: hypothetical protein MUC49_02850 [Raineya sp.]|jgi:bacteriocin-like protein|nr:hypothetical protein [Raineya sp.]